jgi:hypothetical protein
VLVEVALPGDRLDRHGHVRGVEHVQDPIHRRAALVNPQLEQPLVSLIGRPAHHLRYEFLLVYFEAQLLLQPAADRGVSGPVEHAPGAFFDQADFGSALRGRQRRAQPGQPRACNDNVRGYHFLDLCFGDRRRRRLE